MPEPALAGERFFSGPEKAAALLLMMGNPPASRLVKHLDQPELRVLARAAAGLGAVAPPMLDRIVEEFAVDFAAGSHLTGDAGQARNLLADALPPAQVDELLDSALGEGREPNVWEAFANTPESAIIAFLTAERPTTATYLLSRLDPPLGACLSSH